MSLEVKSKLSKAEIISRAMDPNKVMLICKVHNYMPGRDVRKHLGCSQCILADYIKMFAEMPEKVRGERLDQFEGLVRAMCELEDRGELDIKINRHPEIIVEKNALPD